MNVGQVADRVDDDKMAEDVVGSESDWGGGGGWVGLGSKTEERDNQGCAYLCSRSDSPEQMHVRFLTRVEVEKLVCRESGGASPRAALRCFCDLSFADVGTVFTDRGSLAMD